MEFKPPAELSFSGSIAENWRNWRQKLEYYLLATEKEKKEDKVKIAILLNLIGDEGLAIYNTFGLSTETSTYDAVIKKFENYCKEKKNVLFERHKFFKTLRIDGQTIDNYVTGLRTIGANCEFGDQLESLIRDQIVLHLTDQGLQERILRESELGLLKVVEFVKASETTKEQVRLIQEKSVEVHGLRRGNNKSNFNTANDEGRKLNNHFSLKYGNHSGVNSTNNAVDYQCRKCGNKHRANNCPAYGKYCNLCNKPNHFALACFKNKKNISLVKQNKYESEQDYADSLIDSCELVESSRKICKINLLQWSQKLIINNKELEFKLDTGAEINVMPISCLFKLGVNADNICNNRQIILEVFGGNRLKSSGVIKLKCSANNARNCQLSFVVVDDANNNKIKPLLGLDGCVKLNLIKRINDLTVDNQKKMEILKRNEDIFNGTGLIKNYECHIKVDKSVEPVIRPPRRVPLAIRDSPHYPQSNGMVEKAVGICKNLMRKCYKSGQDFNLGLMEYRNCPVTGLSESPAQLMMSRQLRTVLPTIDENLMPNVVRVKEDKELKQKKSKLYYDKTSQQRRGFNEGESVVHRRGRRWEPAQIIKSNNTPRSYIIRTEDGQTLVRNSVHLRKSGNPFAINGDQNSYPTLENNTTESNESNTETQLAPAQFPQESSEITSETYNPALPQAMSRYGRRIIKPRRLVEE
ncbi:unnamed protein product, partial [Brenthis ino]